MGGFKFTIFGVLGGRGAGLTGGVKRKGPLKETFRAEWSGGEGGKGGGKPWRFNKGGVTRGGGNGK